MTSQHLWASWTTFPSIHPELCHRVLGWHSDFQEVLEGVSSTLGWCLVNIWTWATLLQGWKISLRYRLFATDSVRFLGHIVTGVTICPGLGKRRQLQTGLYHHQWRKCDTFLVSPTKQLANLDLPFTVVTNANNVALCGVLLQKDRDNAWHPIAYRSRRQRKEGRVQLYGYGKRNYGRYHALHARKLFFCKPFEVVTDDPGGKYIRTKKTYLRQKLGGSSS